MAVPTPPRSLKIGAIIDKTLGVIERNVTPVLVYIAGLTAINGAIAYFTRDMTRVTDALVLGIAGIAVGIVAAYLLLETVIQRTGLRSRTREDTFLPFCAMSILATLGVIAGFILLIIPGLVIMARWLLAGPLVIARGDGAKQALGESWERTRGAEFSILIALLALVIGPIAVMIAGGLLFEPTDPVGIGISQLASSAMNAVIQMTGVALYAMMVGTPATASVAVANPAG